MEQELTPWFDTDKPVHLGVYQRDHYGTLEYSYWDGHYWRFAGRTPKQAVMLSTTKSRFQNLPWRGLGEKS